MLEKIQYNKTNKKLIQIVHISKINALKSVKIVKREKEKNNPVQNISIFFLEKSSVECMKLNFRLAS